MESFGSNESSRGFGPGLSEAKIDGIGPGGSEAKLRGIGGDGEEKVCGVGPGEKEKVLGPIMASGYLALNPETRTGPVSSLFSLLSLSLTHTHSSSS